MSETPPVHAGTDRVELTEDERAILRGVLHEFKSRTCDDDCSNDTYAAVESIVAARVQEYAEKFESLSDRAKTAATELGAKNDRLAAELAAANARSRELEREIDERDKVHEGIVATITAAARADTRTAKSDAAKVQMLAERVDALTLSRDKHRNRAAAANTRCAELEEEVMAHQVSDGYTKGYEHGTLTTTKFKAESDALQATLDRVAAFIETWSQPHSCAKNNTAQCVPCRMLRDLRAALTPEGTE